MNKAGRKVDLININISEIEDWIQKNNQSKTILKCQSIIALNNGAQMKEVCNVLGVTREAVRLWKEQLRKGGLKELLKTGKVGKRSRLSPVMLLELKKVTKMKPASSNFDANHLTGLLVKQYVHKKWNIEISIRTAYQWLSKAK
jgi:transposase